MKKIYTLITVISIMNLPSATLAQWCVPGATVSYSSAMPGITNFTLHNISRASAGLECTHPCNSFVTTGVTDTLTKGVSNAVSLSHNIDATICPNMNLRIWVDLNQDGQLDDAGELLVTTDKHLPTSAYTSTLTIPATATNGATRMRVCAKMSDDGGHSLPTPCNIPADPIGFHGEYEDYTIVIKGASGTGIESPEAIASLTVFPNPIVDKATILSNSPGRLRVFDLTGREVQESELTSGSNSFSRNELVAGMYFYRFESGDTRGVTGRLVVCN